MKRYERWALAQETQLREKERGIRDTPTTCFKTFPFPDPTPEQATVLTARWPTDIPDTKILTRLLALNLGTSETATLAT